MDLNQYLLALRAHWRGALVILLVVTAATFTYTNHQPKVYAANASGFVGTGPTSGAFGAIGDQLARSRATSYVDVATSRATAQAVIDDLHLSVDPATLVDSISVVQPLNTVLLKITARSSSPRAAQRLADAWVSALSDQVHQIEAPGTKTVPDGVPRIIPIESAELPTSPVEPQVGRNTALGFIVGALLGLAYAVARRNLDRRLRSTGDVESLGLAPVLGAVPRTSLGDDNRVGTHDFPAVEAFRKLRTNLTYMDVDRPPRTIVVTSSRVGDGKSMIAINLATALAESGQDVVLVDADLRRPTLAKRLGLEPAVGVTSVLSGQATLTAALQEVSTTPRLRLLSSGPLPPNPSELLGSQAMRALIERLARSAVVILDTPPLLPVTDAAVLATAADGAFLVITAGRTLDTDLRTALHALDTVNARALGVVVNKERVSSRRYSSYRYAYHSDSATPGASGGPGDAGGPPAAPLVPGSAGPTAAVAAPRPAVVLPDFPRMGESGPGAPGSGDAPDGAGRYVFRAEDFATRSPRT